MNDHRVGATARLILETPLGAVLLEADAAGITALRFANDAGHTPDAEPAAPGSGWLAVAAAQLGEYFAGGRRTFDVPLSLKGTPFQRRVWQALMEIPCGGTRTYGQVAAAVGSPGAARAVGMACHRNPVCILVPCHRVVGAGGSLGGYAWGLARKRRLLALERENRL